MDELTEEAVEAIVELTVGTPLLSFEVRHMGGALREAKPEHGALASIDAAYMGFAVGIPVDAEVDAAIEAQLDLVHERLAPWTASQMYLNFRERSKGSAEFFSPEAYRRLRAVKARYDAADVIRGNHQIRPSRVRTVRRTRRVSRPVRR